MNKEMGKVKKANVQIPTITLSARTVQLRIENERLIRHLERLERGPFGIKKWFRK